MNTIDIEGAKNRLQEYCQQRHIPLPIYTTLEKLGPDHAPEFQVRSPFSECVQFEERA